MEVIGRFERRINAMKKVNRRLVRRVLRDQFAVDSKVQNLSLAIRDRFFNRALPIFNVVYVFK